MIKLGTIDIDGIPGVDKVYLGSSVVWENTPVFRPVQLAQDGNFSDGVNGWEVYTLATTPTVTDGVVKLQKSVSGYGGAMLRQRPSQQFSTSHSYYMRCMAKSGDSSTAVAVTFQNTTWAQGGNTAATTTSTAWTTLEQVASPISNTDYFAIRVGTSASTAGKNGYFKNVILIDLTATYGAGNEPTLAECQQIFTEDYYPYYNPT